jgi:hypothetical protein
MFGRFAMILGRALLPGRVIGSAVAVAELHRGCVAG